VTEHPGVPPDGIVLVGTPIGNLGDLTPRAVEVLRAADAVFCEDTRRTRALLSAAGVPAPRLVALHRHNEAAGAARAVQLAAGGALVALVTDAGMPGVSDPGERVVRAAVAAGVPVTAAPGPSAATVAVALSGLDVGRWCFEGFLPRKGSERGARLAAVSADERPSVIFEAPARVAATLGDLSESCGPERAVVLARELTKRHEEVWRGPISAAVGLAVVGDARGEWVIVVDGAPPRTVDDGAIVAALEERISAGSDRRSAVADVARSLGLSRRRVYELSHGGARDADR